MSEKFEQAARLQLMAAFKQANAMTSVTDSFKMLKIGVGAVTTAISDLGKSLLETFKIFADRMIGASKATDVLNQLVEYEIKAKDRANALSNLDEDSASGSTLKKPQLGWMDKLKQNFRELSSTTSAIGKAVYGVKVGGTALKAKFHEMGLYVELFNGPAGTLKKGMSSLAKSTAQLPFKAISAPFKAIGKIGKAGFGAMKGAFASMGPQMMLASMAGQMLMAGFQAMMEPFEVLGDLFEAFGSILSQLMIPIVNAMMPTFLALIPIFQQVVVALMPVIDAFLKAFDLQALLPVIIAVIPLVVVFANALTSILTAITPLSNFIINVFLGGIQALLLAFEPLADFLSVILMGAVNAIMVPINGIVDGFNSIRYTMEGWIDLMREFGDAMETAGNWVQDTIGKIAGFFTIDTSGWW